MADSAASSSSRSKSLSAAKGRARAASSGDDRRPARAAVEPELQVAREADAELADAGLAPHFDPRQGTLLGFELPAEMLEALTSEGTGIGKGLRLPATAEAVAEAAAASTGQSPAASGLAIAGAASAMQAQPDMLLDDASPDERETPASAAKPAVVRESAGAKQTGDNARASDASAKLLTPETAEKAASPAKAASSRQTARSAPVRAKEPSISGDGVNGASTERASTASVSAASLLSAPSASPSSSSGDAGPASSSEPAESASLARTVASLRGALEQERYAAQQRWRRTRNWLAVALAGVALVFAASVAQTVALVGFAHRAEAAQQQAQNALNDQRAALENLASATSALSARIQTPDGQAPTAAASAPVNSEQPRSKHAKSTHARRLKEKERTR
ncbi:MAG TPA: hypothetical protein VF446_08325 [Trinickia sp.]